MILTLHWQDRPSRSNYFHQWRIYIVKFWMCPPPVGQNSFNFMQFLGIFGKIVCWHPPSPRGVGAPTSGKSWIRHCSFPCSFRQKSCQIIDFCPKLRDCRPLPVWEILGPPLLCNHLKSPHTTSSNTHTSIHCEP